MDKYTETFETWNKSASIYQDKFMDLNIYNDTYDYICNAIDKPNAKLLEVGCGPGNITKYLASKRPDFDILGIDIAPNMINLAKLNNPSANFAVMDSRQIKNLNTKYDGIIIGFCLPYVSQTESNKLIADSYDLLNNNGLIYLSFVEGEADKSGFKESTGGRVYFHYHNLEHLKSQLVKTNFQELNTFKVQYRTSESDFETHTIITAIKNIR